MRNVQRDPGMAGIGTSQTGLARGWVSQQISADITGCLPHLPQTRQHDVGEVLTDPTLLAQGTQRRRMDLGILRVIGELPMQPLHKSHSRFDQRPLGGQVRVLSVLNELMRMTPSGT